MRNRFMALEIVSDFVIRDFLSAKRLPGQRICPAIWAATSAIEVLTDYVKSIT